MAGYKASFEEQKLIFNLAKAIGDQPATLIADLENKGFILLDSSIHRNSTDSRKAVKALEHAKWAIVPTASGVTLKPPVGVKVSVGKAGSRNSEQTL